MAMRSTLYKCIYSCKSYADGMDVATRGDDERLARAIKQLQWRHHRALDARMRELGSTIVQWDVLRALELHPEASAHDLAVATFQSDQSLGVMMRRMVDRGLVERAAVHGRRFEHRPTADGRRLLQAGHEAAAAVLADSFRPLSPEQRGALLSLLQQAGAD